MALNRRQFVVSAAVCCGGLASCTSLQSSAARRGRAGGPVDVGTPTDYAVDGITSRWAESHGFYLVRERGSLFAVSSDCTHKRCLVEPERDGVRDELVCGCHGSRFAPTGEVIKGPARLPLPHLAISRDERGRMIVDPAKRLDESQWGLPGSFIAV